MGLWLCLLLPCFVNAQDNNNDIPVTVNGKKYYKHTVEKKETIYGIAEKFGLKPKDIILENPSAIDGVKVGDILIIPIVPSAKPGDNTKPVTNAPSKAGAFFYHDVLEKETLYSLSKKYNTTVNAIDSLNPEITVKGLKKGQKIRIPLTENTTGRDSVKATQSNPVTAAKPEETHPIKRDSIKPQQTSAPVIPAKKPDESSAYKNLVIQQTHADTAKAMAPIQDTGRKKYRYNIVLIMPFASENADTLRINRLIDGSEQVPLTTRISVDYYHGFVMALDSLAKRGFKANLHVFNILPGADSSSYILDSILKNPNLSEANLIIGPPYPSNFKKVARFADKHHIPIVSPLSPENYILKNNPYTSKAIPSSITEIEAEADFIASHYAHDNIIIIHNRSANDEYYEVFKKRFHKSDSALGNKDTLRRSESQGGVSSLSNKIVKYGANIIVVPYQGAPFVAKFVNEIGNSEYSRYDSLILFGMHNWANNDALAGENLDTLNFHFPSNEHVNYQDPITKKFITKYRNNYLSEPSEYSYQGFDLGMFYINLLSLYGSDMQNHLGDIKYRGLQTSFDMSRINPASGYENKAVYILEYKNYTEKVDTK